MTAAVSSVSLNWGMVGPVQELAAEALNGTTNHLPEVDPQAPRTVEPVSPPLRRDKPDPPSPARHAYCTGRDRARLRPVACAFAPHWRRAGVRSMPPPRPA